MTKQFLIGIICLIMFVSVLFVQADRANASILPAQEKSFVKNMAASSFAVFALQELVLPPDEEDGSIFTNPFYIASAFFILALVFEIIYFKKKKNKEKLENTLAKTKYSSSVEIPEFKQKVHPKRYSKEQMSELLKASAAKPKNGQIRASSDPDAVIISDEEIQAELEEQFIKDAVQEMGASTLSPKPLRVDWVLREPPALESLPQIVEDESFFDALVDIENEEAMVRCLAARILAKYRTGNSVKLLSRAAMDDLDNEVKLEAIESLRILAHDSCFAPLLAAASDVNPNVKQAAVKALTTLSVNLADNYTRLVLSNDEEINKRVAKSCIANGLAHKAFMQIISNDYEQGYEGFALLSFLAKAGETKPLIDAIRKHPSMEIRTLCVRIMNNAHKPDVKEEMYGLLSR